MPACIKYRLELKIIKNIVLGLFLLSFASVGAQNPETTETAEDQSLKGKFQELIDKSESFQEYKVIKRDRLTSFWAEVNDTLVLNGTDRSRLHTDLKTANKNISALEVQLRETKEELEKVTFEKDRMSFLGLELIKSSYSYLVWGIILGLLILLAAAYVRFISTSRIAERIKTENRELQSESEEFKKNAREKETKLKRELQTEINTVEELKQRVTLPKN